MGSETSDLFFEIYINTKKEEIPQTLLDLARELILEIVELDSTARSIGGDHGENERLAYISLSCNQARFTYWATSFNTEWDVVFKKLGSSSWACLGIPDHKI